MTLFSSGFRATSALTFARHLPRSPAAAFRGQRCAAPLSSSLHAHVDYEGRYLTGLLLRADA